MIFTSVQYRWIVVPEPHDACKIRIGPLPTHLLHVQVHYFARAFSWDPLQTSL